MVYIAYKFEFHQSIYLWNPKITIILRQLKKFICSSLIIKISTMNNIFQSTISLKLSFLSNLNTCKTLKEVLKFCSAHFVITYFKTHKDMKAANQPFVKDVFKDGKRIKEPFVHVVLQNIVIQKVILMTWERNKFWLSWSLSVSVNKLERFCIINMSHI